MPARLPAIPTLPPGTDPRVRHAFDKMREYLLAMSGVRGDPRDYRLTSEDANNLYRRIYELETAAAQAARTAVRTGALAGTEQGDGAAIMGYVGDGVGIYGAILATEGGDGMAFAGAINVNGAIAATCADDTCLIAGTVT